VIKLISINLNQAESRTAKLERWRERGRWVYFSVLMAALIALASMFALLNNRLSGQIRDRQATIDRVQAEIARLQAQLDAARRHAIMAESARQASRLMSAWGYAWTNESEPKLIRAAPRGDNTDE